METNGWQDLSLSDLATIVGGGTPSRRQPVYWDGDVPWATPTDVTGLSGRVISETASSITDAGLASSSATLLPPNSLLMTTRATIGACAVNRVSMATNQGFQNLVPKQNTCVEFLYYLIQHQQRHLERMAAGSTFLEVSKRAIRGFRVSAPPLPEQRKIAAILSSVDDAIEKTQAVIDQVQVLKRGLMQKLLTRGLPGRHTRFKQTEIGKMPEEWSCVSLGSLVVGHNSGVYKKADLYGRGHNIVGVSDLYDCHSIDGQQFRLVPLEPRELSRYTLHEGDLIYGESSLVREGIARTLPVTQRGAGTAFAWHTRRVRLDYEKTDAIFYHYVLDGGPTRKRVMAVATQTALTGITTKDFFSVPVPLPAMDEQREISRILTSNDKFIEECQDSIDGLQAVKSALVSVLLTGELRVTADTEAP